MTHPIDTPARLADIRSGKLMEHDQTGSMWLLVAMIGSAVFWIALIGWLAFSESVRCDPCEWVVMDAPGEGW